MRTTLTLEPDVAQGIEELRRQSGRSLKRTVNDLLRSALAGRAAETSAREPATLPSSSGRILVAPEAFDEIGAMLAEIDEDELRRGGS